MFLKNIVELRQVTWARNYLWDIKFRDSELREPFNEWFPAKDVEEPIYGMESYDFIVFNQSFQVPKSKTQLAMSITFYDNDDQMLLHWLEKWVASIHNSDGTVSTLSEIVKQVWIKRLKADRTELKTDLYTVFPTGELTYPHASESTPTTHTLALAVVGKVPGDIQ